MDYQAAWENVDALQRDQKFEAASAALDTIRENARAAGDEEPWTRAFIAEVQLRTALHGYETAVRFLKDEPWPADPLWRSVLELYYAQSLVTYARQYSYEIRQRERVAGDDEVDLKLWTLDQIITQANQAFERVWALRESWGERSLGALARYIDQNNYPARIRGTLRDAVSYLWVDLLGETTFWRPEHDNEIFRLDLAALIRGGEDTDFDLADPDIHPLRRLCAVLDDLETWHREREQYEAALEARLERLRKLHVSMESREDKLAIRDHLEETLDRFDRSYPWWSMGQWQLANFLGQESAPDARIRSLAAAEAGRDRHPESIGGQRCAHLAAAIERPQLNIAAMATDAAYKRSIQISHANLERAYFRAWRFDLAARIESGTELRDVRRPWPDRQELEDWIRNREPDLTWTVALPPTADYGTHTTYTTLPAERSGAYVVAASAREDFQDRTNAMTAVPMIVGDLVLVARELEDAFEFTARSGETGEPLTDVTVTIYSFGRRADQTPRTLTVGADGVATLATGGAYASYVAFARRGDDLAMLDRLHSRRRPTPRERTASFIYTDRSVYRPGQTIHWKAVAYRGGGEEYVYETLPDQELIVALKDRNHQEVLADTVRTNAFGSASGSFTIPTGRLLGDWQLRCSIPGEAYVKVEEYKRPTFEVTVADPEAPLRLNEPAELTGKVAYYFGLPVVTGEVVWRVTREPVFPRWWWFPPAGRVQTVAGGRTTLNDDGSFTVAFTPLADERLEENEGVTYNYRLSVDVTDEGGETRSAARNFRLGFVSVAASITTEDAFLRAGGSDNLTVTRTNLDGVARPGAGRWRLVALQQPETTPLPADLPVVFAPDDENPYRTEGDYLRPRWQTNIAAEQVMAQWPDGRQVRDGTLEHGEDGQAKVDLSDLAPGAYRLHYETEDDFGAICRARRDFLVVAAETTPLALPLVLQPERASVAVGETARIFVRSGLPDQEMVLELFQDGKRFERRVLRAGRDKELIELPVTRGLRGGFLIRLTALRDHQLMQLYETVTVPWDDRKLQVEFATFRDRLRPGTEETFRVTVRGGADEGSEQLAATAELLAYMYDRSLDIFATHRPPQPLALYPTRSNGGWTTNTLQRAGLIWRGGDGFGSPPDFPQLHGDYLRVLDGYGIGGMGRRFKSAMMRAGRGGEMMETMAMRAPAPDDMVTEELEIGAIETPAMPDGESAGDKGVAEPPAALEEPIEPRRDFSETAFFAPHLLLDADGGVTIEFKVPDSVTEWNVWVHAVTRDLRSGSVEKQTTSVKELMVRPYLPRFLREGDRAELKVVVNNAGEGELSGRLDFELFDPDTEEDLRAVFGLSEEATTGVPFTVAAGGGVDLTFPITTPARVGPVVGRVTARAGDFSDGEQRSLPVLPGRMHLMQSRFASLREGERRTLRFADLAANDDPTRINEQMVVTIDAQLFYSVLNALPYLVNYPYECTEQLLNKFVSTGILTSVFDQYPAVAAMAQKLSKRETRLEPWVESDPNRKLLLEESPWLVRARGGDETSDDLINVLDPEIARAQRTASLSKLEQAQDASGGFPWWPGGRPSPYMTLYLLYGFSKALEFDVEVPREMVVKAWRYLQQHYEGELADKMLREDCCWEQVTFLNYVLSSYPDESWTGGVFTADDRRTMLDFSFKHWREHSPLLKGYLTLTLVRSDRRGDAQLVFDSVMDSAKQDEDLGTYWAPEDRAWLWYNDTIESHAFALRVLTELAPDDARRHGLVQWLLLNKKLNHWSSTKATAEVIYSLVHYLEHEDQLGQREVVAVTVGPRSRTFDFEPDEYTGAHNRLLLTGDEIDPQASSTITVQKEGPGTAFASATWHFSTERLPETAAGDLFTVTRRYFRRHHDGKEWVLTPLAAGGRLAVGDQVEVQLDIAAKHAAEFVHLRDPRGAGFEPESTTSGHRWGVGLGYYEEVRDSGENFFFDWVPAGQYTLKYRLRANMAGTFKFGPAVLQSMYAPEFVAYSAGEMVGVE